MKTTFSFPERILRRAERHARRIGKSKDQLVVSAVTEYLARHDASGSEVTTSRRKSPGSPKSRFSKTKLRQMARNHPPTKSLFDEPLVDLTRPAKKSIDAARSSQNGRVSTR